MVVRATRLLLSAIKFEHSVFALPFALLGACLARPALDVSPREWLLLAGCMVTARSYAMAVNRLSDLRYDLLNPRTREWPLPSGKIRPRAMALFGAAMAAAFVALAAQFNAATAALAPAALALLGLYSFSKRFTFLCHFLLGLALGLSPVAASVALLGRFTLPPILLGAAVLFWVAGFDILYACQDAAFDRETGLHSIPARFGIPAAFRAARACHLLMVALLAALPFLPGARWGALYGAGVGLVVLLLVVEHRLVRPDDLSRMNAAFFTVNGFVSVLLLLAAVADLQK